MKSPLMTSDYDALLAAILDNPADDAPRLVFSDWLEEHGEGERAEFIRVQCRIAEMEATGKGMYREVIPLRRHERELWLKNGCIWLAGTPLVGMDSIVEQDNRVIWRRGFVAEVTCRLADWVGGECPECDPNCRGYLAPDHIHDGPRCIRGPRCPTCSGTGRTPAHGPAIVRQQPVELVRVTDREPLRSGGFYYWYDDRREGGIALAMHYLPTAIFDLMVDAGNWFDYQFGGSSLNSLDAAHAALSAALILWAKQ